MTRIPEHWYKFDRRKPSTARTAENATDPVNAILNYAYRLCEVEARNACHITGLDPAIGIGHGHDKGTDALVFDLMETARPEADRIILAMLDTGRGMPIGTNGRPSYFKTAWFHETRDGQCRLVAPLTHTLAELVTPAVAKVIGFHADRVARELAHVSPYDARIPVLPRANRIPGMPGQRHAVPLHSDRDPKPSVIGAGSRNASNSTVREAASIDHRPRNFAGTLRLDASLSPADIIPDHIWSIVAAMIPPEPVVRTHKPNPRINNRAVLAGIVCHEIHGTSWAGIPPGLGVDRKTCRRRLDEWSRLGAWPEILEAVTRPGLATTSEPVRRETVTA